jgi:HEPN domain-containing protein
MSSRKSNYTAWLAKVDNDLLNIDNNLAAERVPWDTVCFHAQQAAEKLLKAYLVYHGRTPTRTHDLVALLARCVEIATGLTALEGDCRSLTYYAVGSRYPDDLFDPEEGDARAMLEALRHIRAAIQALLPVPEEK